MKLYWMKKVVFTFLITLFMPSIVFAHSGGTDANGGHKNENGWYHYHHGYLAHTHYQDICPYYLSETAYDTTYPWEYESFLDEYVEGFECGYDIGAWVGEDDGYNEYHSRENLFDCESEYDGIEYPSVSPYSYGYSDGYRLGYCLAFEDSYNNESLDDGNERRCDYWEIEEAKAYGIYEEVEVAPEIVGTEEPTVAETFSTIFVYTGVIVSIAVLLFGLYWFLNS